MFMKPISTKLHIIALCGIVPILSSCDTSFNGGEDIVLTETSRGFSIFELESNPTAIASFPNSLLQGEVLDIQVPFSLNDASFLEVTSVGQVIIDTFGYNFTASVADDSIATLERSDLDTFFPADAEAELELILAQGAGTVGSFNDALTLTDNIENNVVSFDENENEIIAITLESVGLIQRANPISNLREILNDQLYTLQITSTNQDLLDNGIISGTVTEFSEFNLFLVESVNNGEVGQTLGVGIGDDTNSTETLFGTFTLQLNSLEN